MRPFSLAALSPFQTDPLPPEALFQLALGSQKLTKKRCEKVSMSAHQSASGQTSWISRQAGLFVASHRRAR